LVRLQKNAAAEANRRKIASEIKFVAANADAIKRQKERANNQERLYFYFFTHCNNLVSVATLGPSKLKTKVDFRGTVFELGIGQGYSWSSLKTECLIEVTEYVGLFNYFSGKYPLVNVIQLKLSCNLII
jgi:hypothetical protein